MSTINRGTLLAVFVMICLLSAVVWPLFIVRAEAVSRIICVDAGNVNDPEEDGSTAHPFDSIQEGVDAAASDDTVQVAAGVYRESVQISKSSISLVGQKDGTIIDGNGTLSVGIRLYHTPPNYTESVSISGFTVRNCVKGITLSRSIYTHLRDNSMVGNKYNFGDYTLQVQDIDTSNTVDGKPIYFWNYQRDKQIPSDAGFVAVVDSENITVKDLDLAHNVQGLILKNTTRSLVENVSVHDSWDGLYLERWSNSNKIIHCSVYDNLFMGLYVSTSSSNIIADNAMLNNAYGILLDSSVFEYTEGFSPTGNTVEDNNITRNTVANSGLDGVYLIGCVDNFFFDNNFDNNTRQVESFNSTSRWDDGTEGNLWSDYAGKDLDHDGFGDSAYVIDENNTDNHPLTGFPSYFPATWQNESYSVATVSNSMVSTFEFSQRDKLIGFEVNGSGGAFGFCRASIPVSLLGGPYTLMLDGVSSKDFVSTSNETHSFLYFTYSGAHEVKISGVSVVPEYPSFLLVLLLACLTAGAVLVKSTWKKTAPAPPR